MNPIPDSKFLRFSRYFWSSLLGLAGISHFLHPDFFIAYYPNHLPFPREAVWTSGALELLLAGLLYVNYRRPPVWLSIAVLMIVYFPVHLYVITHHHLIDHPIPKIPLWLAWIRLPLQLVLIGWPLSILHLQNKNFRRS
jgi:uncharacterized membrane protein